MTARSGPTASCSVPERFRHGGGGFDVPAAASLDPWALTLSAAVFRFRVGVSPTLRACAGANVGLHWAGLV